MEVRAEQPADVAAVYQVNVAAFGRAQEANLVNQLRGVTATFSLVAVAAGQIVGHIFFSPVTIAEEAAADVSILGLGPVAVRPNYQGQGIGSLLIQQGLAACTRCGFKAIVVLGAPAYYSRFGFVPAQQQGLRCEYSVPAEAFMVLELASGALAGRGGTIKYRSEFNDLE
jgi:putative acetyltransferase